MFFPEAPSQSGLSPGRLRCGTGPAPFGMASFRRVRFLCRSELANGKTGFLLRASSAALASIAQVTLEPDDNILLVQRFSFDRRAVFHRHQSVILDDFNAEPLAICFQTARYERRRVQGRAACRQATHSLKTREGFELFDALVSRRLILKDLTRSLRFN